MVCFHPSLSTLRSIIQTQTYRPQVRELKVGPIHLKDVASGFSKHIQAEAHPLLEK